jgi:hypothetical protein
MRRRSSMNLDKHFALRRTLNGTHSFLSPSSPSWVNYDDDKLDRVFYAAQAAREGTERHEYAHRAIKLRIKQLDVPKTINLYINDAIGYRMESEVLLYYSDNCYGTADCVGFQNNTLRIHDLKTGTNVASMRQLEVYAALFCLDFSMRPFDIGMELRIYQNNAVKIHNPESIDIIHIMEKIRSFDKRINELKLGD